MKIKEIINELTYQGSPCTKDCSGHKAGDMWARKKGINNTADCNSHSSSFNNGCAIGVNNTGKRAFARNEKGRFVSVPKRPQKPQKPKPAV
jgi:hypothetical protein